MSKVCLSLHHQQRQTPTKMTSTNDRQVFDNIFTQLGAGRFTVMTGATKFGFTKNSLQCRFKGSRVANHLKVTLDPSDTYTVTFSKVGKYAFKEVKTLEGIYNDQLQRIFTETTGLFTSL